MKKQNVIVASLIAVALIVNVLFVNVTDANVKPVIDVDSVIESAYVEERVLDIPADDSGLWDVMLVTGNSETDKQAAEWFNSDPHLQRLKASTKFTHYQADSKLYRERFEKYYGNNHPTIGVQMPDGKLAFRIDAKFFPTSSKNLVHRIDDAIKRTVEQCRPGGGCPREPKKPREPFIPRIPDDYNIDVNHNVPDLGIEENVDKVTGLLSGLLEDKMLLIVAGLGLFFVLKKDK